MEGNHSLRAEFGMYYSVPDEVVEAMREQEEEEEEEEKEGGARGRAALQTDEDEDEDEDETQPHVVDKMRVMWKGKPVTVRTRDGTGDSAIAGTKVRLVGAEPAEFEMALFSDLKAGIQKGEVQVLSEADDPTDVSERPADVLRSDKHVTGTLYAQLAWPFAGGGARRPAAAPPPRRPAAALCSDCADCALTGGATRFCGR